uniref:Uncharacterized protein n=1 Tax=Arundo donax TaxID=35708 RepID=A0A0A9GDD3_ARUDO
MPAHLHCHAQLKFFF